MDTTLRDQIMEHLKTRFSDQRKDVNGANITWDVVSREPLTKTQQEEGNTVGLYDTSERAEWVIGKTEKYMNVVVEGHVKVLDGDPIAPAAQLGLAECQRVMGLDIYCGGLSMRMEEKGNEIEIAGPDDRIIGFVTIWEIHYRHKVNNPFER